MGKQSDVICGYLDEDKRFADLFNGGFFQGKQVIKANDLKEASEVYVGKVKTSQSSYQRIRDIKKRLDNGVVLRVLAIEGQTYVDYAMPWRCLNYDDLEYCRQVKRIRKRNQESGVYGSKAERLCGIKKTDRLIPVYTICLYYGEEPWDGPRCLKDMMDFGQGNLSCFHTPLKELFTIMRYRRDKKGLKKLLQENPVYQSMDEETAQVIGVIMGVDKFMEKREKYRKEETYNMCQALQEMMEDSRQDGKAEGIKAGREEVIRILVETYRDFGVGREEAASMIRQKCSIPRDRAEEYVCKFWE